MLPLLIDKETNTEVKKKDNLAEDAVSPARGSSIRRSQTFSPAGRPSHIDYICRVRLQSKTYGSKISKHDIEANVKVKYALSEVN